MRACTEWAGVAGNRTWSLVAAGSRRGEGPRQDDQHHHQQNANDHGTSLPCGVHPVLRVQLQASQHTQRGQGVDTDVTGWRPVVSWAQKRRALPQALPNPSHPPRAPTSHGPPTPRITNRSTAVHSRAWKTTHRRSSGATAPPRSAPRACPVVWAQERNGGEVPTVGWGRQRRWGRGGDVDSGGGRATRLPHMSNTQKTSRLLACRGTGGWWGSAHGVWVL